MNIKYLLKLILFFFFFENSYALDLKKLDDIYVYSLEEDDYARFQYIDPSFNNYFVGKTNSIGNGDYDYLLVKTDSNDELIFYKSLGGIGDDQGYYIYGDNDFIYLAGRSNSFGNGKYDALIAKYTLNGDLLFSKFYGGEQNDYAKTIKELSNGNLMFVGRSSSYLDKNLDAWFVEIDKKGNILKNMTYGEVNQYDEFRNFIEVTDGYLFIGHSHNKLNEKKCLDKNKDMKSQSKCFDAYIVKTDFNGNEKNNLKFGSIDAQDSAKDIIKTNKNEFIVTGIKSLGSESNNQLESNVLLLKLDKDANLIEDLSFSVGVYGVGYSIYLLSESNIIITGKTKNEEKNFDLFVANFNIKHNELEWLKILEKKGYDEGMSVVLNENLIQILGRSDSFNNKMDFIKFKIDFEGNIVD